MAIRKTGLRRIVVDGVEYRWKFSRKPTQVQWECWGGCAAFVQIPDGTGSLLVVQFPQHHPGVASVVGFPVVSVLPSQIANAIRRALATGWRPSEAGSSFWIGAVVSA